jgi:hypothetical protein
VSEGPLLLMPTVNWTGSLATTCGVLVVWVRARSAMWSTVAVVVTLSLAAEGSGEDEETVTVRANDVPE